MATEMRGPDRFNAQIDDSKVSNLGRNVIIAFVVTTGLLAVAPILLQYPFVQYPVVNGPDTRGEAIANRLSLYFQIWSIGIPSLIAFFGFYRARGDMRDAIAGSLVVAFIAVLVESMILNLGLFEQTAGTLRSVVVSNFMTLVGTVVAFYVGSEAAIRVGGQYAEAKAREIALRDFGPALTYEDVVEEEDDEK